MRDYALGTTFDIKITSRAFLSGQPTNLSGSPAVAAYPDNSNTEITAGITWTQPFDGRAGLANIRVVATVGNGYAAGVNYALVMTDGNMDGTTIVGETVGEFSIEAQSPLRPATAGRTALVAADGSISPNWADVKSPTTAVGLTNTTIATSQVVASVSGAVGSVTGAVGSVTGAVGSVSGNVGGNVNGNVVGNVNGNLLGNVGGIVVGSVGSVAAPVTTTAADQAASADVLLGRNIAGGSSTGRTVSSALYPLRNRVEITAGGSVVVYLEDDVTPAWTGVATRTPGANPLTQIAPA